MMVHEMVEDMMRLNHLIACIVLAKKKNQTIEIDKNGETEKKNGGKG
jgi:hypothetical protein